jgi:tripartite-type tricarboxylate transporter receptor subunit TctC
MKRKFLTGLVQFAALAMGAATCAQAQEGAWPNKPVRVVVPYAAGGTSDALGRSVAQHLQTVFKQGFVVDNRGGGGGTIGSAQVAKSAPDGYTLVVSGIGSHVIAPVDIKVFNPMSDFTHIAMLGGPPTVLVVNSSVPANTLKEFVNYAQQLNGGVSWGSPGKGTHGDLIGELFARDAKYAQTQVGYKGAGPAMNDLLGGQIQAAFITYRSASAFIKAGKVRALAITSTNRLPDMPDVPTFAESGYPKLTATTWFSLSGPAGMPPKVVAKINEEVRRGLQTESARRLFEQEGIEFHNWDAPTFTKYMQSEINRWVPIVKDLAKNRAPQ